MYTTNKQIIAGYVYSTPQYESFLAALAASFTYVCGREFSYHRCNHDDDGLTLFFQSDSMDYTMRIGDDGEYFSYGGAIDQFAEAWDQKQAMILEHEQSIELFLTIIKALQS